MTFKPKLKPFAFKAKDLNMACCVFVFNDSYWGS